MIPPYSLSQLTTRTWSFEQDADCWARHGVQAVGVTLDKLNAVGMDRAKALLSRENVKVALLQTCGRFAFSDAAMLESQLARTRRELDQAQALGAGCVVLASGSDPQLSWEENLPLFLRVIDRLLPEAERRGVRIAFEPSHALRAENSFVHTFHDALDIADMVDSTWFGVLLEINNAWIERGLYRNIAERVHRIAMVQVSDYKIGTLVTPERMVMGDGDIPIRRIVHALRAAGYDGYYDIELIGPAIDREGYESMVPRTLAAYRALWEQK